MTTKDTVGADFPAFPVTAGNQVYATGMTLRDWFAGQALSRIAETYRGGAFDPEWVARAAYQFADAMLRARTEATP